MAGSKRRHTDTDNSDNKPSWDGNSITMRKWLNDIYLYLEEADRDFETLVTSGYVLSKNITVVPTVHHAKALVQCSCSSRARTIAPTASRLN